MASDENPPFQEDASGNTFDSHLEIPTSGDPHHNATLTITLRYKLEFADGKNRVGVIHDRDGTPRAVDRAQFAHFITDWDTESRSKFTAAMWGAQRIWSYKFMLITPRSYSGLDFKHLLPGHYVRPNVMCALRLEPWGTPHIKITVVRVSDQVEFTSFTSMVPPRNMLIDESAPKKSTLGHELGHALGMLHIKGLRGDQACITGDVNAPRCYGDTPQELANIMGGGRDLWPLNAAPWLDRIALHTKTQAAFWTPTMDMTTKPQILTFAQHVFYLPMI
jgi:hypothetical protein